MAVEAKEKICQRHAGEWRLTAEEEAKYNTNWKMVKF
jgi:hypothetical protein